MRSVIIGFSFVFFSILTSQNLYAKKLSFNPEIRLYTSDGQGYRAAEVGRAITSIAAQEASIILFVHGRGNEPKKSLSGAFWIEGKAVQKLESQYGVPVLMFNWNSKARGRNRSRPLKNMPVAAEALNSVLNALVAHQNKQAAPTKISFLVHSMGTVVLETLIDSYGWSFNDTFETIVLTGSDSDADGHVAWLDKISQEQATFVTINNDDIALRNAKKSRQRGVLPLGRDPGVALAPGVRYVEFTKLGKEEGEATNTHEAFNKEAMENHVALCSFFEMTLKGNIPKNVDGSDIYDPGTITKVEFHRDENHSCFSSDKSFSPTNSKQKGQVTSMF